MANPYTALANLKGQQALRHPDGRWNIAIVIDPYELSKTCIEQFKSIAQQKNISLQMEWISPPKDVHNICVIGHSRRELIDNLLEWGEKGWLQKRYLILFSCGVGGATPLDFKQLNDELKVSGSITFAHNISPNIVAIILEEWLH